MGFWQTGYYEFHEPVGFEGILIPAKPIKYPCPTCQSEFDSLDELRAHRFDRHPLHRPALVICGREVGDTQLRITEALSATDIEISSETEAVRLNGIKTTSLDRVREALAAYHNDVVIIELSSQGVWANYRLLFDIASDTDLAGVDGSFVEMVQGRRLDSRTIGAFIDKSFGSKTAHTYCEGICEYLYGILAKEQSADSSLPYEKYREKFNRAADILKDYRQPLGQMIGAIIAFHFNQFGTAYRLGRSSRIGSISRHFQEWIEAPLVGQPTSVPEAGNSPYDEALTDRETERIIRICTAELETVGTHLQEISALLDADILEADRTKLWILASESCRIRNDHIGAAKYARRLLNNPSFGAWAERSTENAKKAM